MPPPGCGCAISWRGVRCQVSATVIPTHPPTDYSIISRSFDTTPASTVGTHAHPVADMCPSAPHLTGSALPCPPPMWQGPYPTKGCLTKRGTIRRGQQQPRATHCKDWLGTSPGELPFILRHPRTKFMLHHKDFNTTQDVKHLVRILKGEETQGFVLFRFVQYCLEMSCQMYCINRDHL